MHISCKVSCFSNKYPSYKLNKTENQKIQLNTIASREDYSLSWTQTFMTINLTQTSCQNKKMRNHHRNLYQQTKNNCLLQIASTDSKLMTFR